MKAEPAIAMSAAPRLVRIQGSADKLWADDEAAISSETSIIERCFINENQLAKLYAICNRYRMRKASEQSFL